MKTEKAVFALATGDHDEYNENSLSWIEVVCGDCGGNPIVISWVLRGGKWIDKTFKRCL